MKTLTQMAKEIGTIVRGWLRRDHWPLWMDYWASDEELCEAEQQTRAQLSQGVREAKREG